MEAIINDVFGRFWWVRYAKVRPVRTDYCDPARKAVVFSGTHNPNTQKQ